MKCKGSLVYIQSVSVCQCSAAACFSAQASVYCLCFIFSGIQSQFRLQTPKSCMSAECEAYRRAQCCCSASSCGCFLVSVAVKCTKSDRSHIRGDIWTCVHSFPPKKPFPKIKVSVVLLEVTHEFLFSILVFVV